MRRLLFLLPLGLVALAGEEPAVVRAYDVADLAEDETWHAIAISRAKAAAGGAEVRTERNTLVVAAPAEAQERIARELAAVREAFGTLVSIEVRLVRIEGGAGVAAVPEAKLDAFLEEKGAKDLAAPALVCRNGQRCSIDVARELSFVADFRVAADAQGNVTVDPVVETVTSGIRAKLRPFIDGQKVRVAAEVTVTDLEGQWPEVEIPLPLKEPLKVQVPEGKAWSVSRLVRCEQGAYAALDVGGPWVVLLKASTVRLADPAPGDGQEPAEIPLR